MEILTETVKVNLENIVGYTFGAVRREMGYLIHYRKNVDNLRDEVGDLGDAIASVQHGVDAARMNVEEIEVDVLRWLTCAEGITVEVQRFFEEESQAKLKCCNGCYFNLKARYQGGKRAYKMGLAVKETKDRNHSFEVVTHRVPIQERTAISPKSYEDFESRKLILDGVMKALKKDNICVIGVYGMGGIGKTMLVGKVATQAIEDKLFEMTVTVVVSQTPDMKKIQKDIAKELGLSFKDEETDFEKAHLLHERLKKEKKILIIIDGIWKKLDLESLGISFGDDQKGCKLLLTSRSRDALGTNMDAQVIFHIGVLLDNEAKSLFTKIVGDLIEASNFQSTMDEVVKECAGLPIAITIVANALKNEKNLKEWKNALQQLKRKNPTEIKELHEKVYLSIRLSYNLLTKEARSLFLFCSLFQEDEDIPIALLWRFLVGLDFYEDVYTMEEVRNMVYASVESLKDCCLLLDGNESGTIKMHDVIRDVAIYIADKDKEMLTLRSSDDLEKCSKLKDAIGITLFDVKFSELPERLECPQLNFIFLTDKDKFSPIPNHFFKRTEEPIPNNFFEGIKELKSLVLKGACLPLPSSLSSLHNLQTLFLLGCELEDMAIIGELKNLIALTLSGSNIKQLPIEIRQLTHLQLLDLKRCTKLEVIPSNVFSNLRRLEELDMTNSFNKWQVDEEITERSNSRVSELDHLSHLTTLRIHIPNAKILPNALLFDRLVRYEMLIGYDWDWDSASDNEFEISRKLKLELDRSFQVEDGIKILLKSCEYLDLALGEGIKNILYEVDMEGFPQLKHLYVRTSTTVQHIIDSVGYQCVAFPVLELLSLENMINLENICRRELTMGSFYNLKKLEVSNCDSLAFVFSSSMLGCFLQIQEIVIKNCKVMHAIVAKERKHEIQVDDIADIKIDITDFTKLRSLDLQNLPNLMGFYSDVDSQLLFNEKVAFFNLEEIYIESIDNLKMLWHNQLVPNSFCKLKQLRVEYCENLMNIFPSKMLRSLQNLEDLQIRNCNSVKEAFEVRGANVDERHDLVSTQLRVLRLINLPKLRHVWTSDPQSISTFSNLRDVQVSSCKGLKSIFPVSVAKSLEQLESLHIHDCGLEGIVAMDEGLETSTKFVFPRLVSLYLESLPELKCFYPKKHTSVWPSLNRLRIHKCDKVKIVALNELGFLDMDGFGHHVSVQQPLFLIEKDTFSNLKELELDWNDTKNQAYGQLFGEFFCQLEVLRLHGKDDKSIAVPLVFVEGLCYLKVLYVSNLFFKEIFRVDSKGQYVGTFEHLIELNLWKMPKLMHLWKENSPQGRAFENLEILQVSECGRLKNLVPSSMYFRNLNILGVSECHGLISLVTSSTAKSLIQLKELTLSECKRMVEIVTDEGEGEAGDEICFNRLNILRLHGLCTLRSFHLGNCTIKFPSLEYLTVTRCPELKIFSNGVLSMPKLKEVGLGETIGCQSKEKCYRRKMLIQP